jgi:hypothetical protein
MNLQTGIAPITSIKPNTDLRSKPILLLYKGRGPSPHHNAGERWRREGEGPAGPDLEGRERERGGVGAAEKEKNPSISILYHCYSL